MFLIAADASWENLWGYAHIAKMAFGLGMVIFVHELGHFLVAKACGVKCEKFYIGFDVPMPKIGPFQIPSKIFHFQWGETEYGLGIIPLGGYVKMLGQDDNPANAEQEAEKTRVKKEESAADVAGVGDGAAHSDDHHKSITDVDMEPQPLAEDVDYELDPRSYTAKNVPQRMAIISAGVIMNVIFAVVFATIAYRLGVPYTPAVIGSTTPGSPAWKMDLQPGTQVLAIGEDAAPREHMRFMQDMAQAVMLHGYEKDITLKLREPGSDSIATVSIRPVPKRRRMMLGKPTASIGVGPASRAKLAAENFIVSGFPSEKVEDQLQGNDMIVAGIIGGVETPFATYWDLERFLAQHVDEPISLRVKRTVEVDEETKKTTTHIIEFGTRNLRRLGLTLTMGPITAVQAGSPAVTAAVVGDADVEEGFQEGDVLQSVDGEPIADPLTVADDLRRLAGQEVIVGVMRTDNAGKRSDVQLRVTPRDVRVYQSAGADDAPILVDALGLTFDVEPTVAAVNPRSDAHGTIKPGDKITAFKIVPAGDTDAQKKKNKKELKKLFGDVDKSIDLTDERYAWSPLHFAIQFLPPEARVELTYVRNGKQQTLELSPYASEDYHFPSRGVRLQGMERIHVAESWGEALSLGVRETKESLLLVVTFLRKLVSGEISPLNLGGPGLIVAAASSEASVSTSRLLIFLTMLSANLAVVNFLPIPVLDGGHMMFLLYEGIFRRPVNEAWQIRLSLLGFAFLLCLMAFVISLDIARFTGMFG